MLDAWHIILQVDLTEYVEKHGFVFDAVLDEDVSNDEVINNLHTLYNCSIRYYKFILNNLDSFFLQVYRETVEPVVPAIFNRTKATCFAYGQTGISPTSSRCMSKIVAD